MLAQPNAMSMFQNEMRRRLGFGPSQPQASSSPAAGPIGMVGNPSGGMSPASGAIPGMGAPNASTGPYGGGSSTGAMDSGSRGGFGPPNSPTGPYGGGRTNGLQDAGVEGGQLPFSPMGLPQHFTPAPIFGGFNAMQHPGMSAPTSFPMFQSQAPQQNRRISLLQPWMG